MLLNRYTENRLCLGQNRAGSVARYVTQVPFLARYTSEQDRDRLLSTPLYLLRPCKRPCVWPTPPRVRLFKSP